VPNDLTSVVEWSRETDSIEWKRGRTSNFIPWVCSILVKYGK